MHKQYMTEIHKNLGYLGTWFPNLLVRVGDIVTFDQSGFTRVGHIADRGIKIIVRTNNESSSYDYASRGAVTIKAGGGLQSQLPKGRAIIAVEFSRSDAILFQATGCHSSLIENQDTLAQEIEFKYEQGSWAKDQFVVTEVIAASGATIVISSSDEARIELIAKGRLQSGRAQLADVEAGFKIASSSHVSLQIVAEKRLTPLFKARGMTWTLAKGRKFGWRGRGSQEEVDFRERATASVNFLTPEHILKSLASFTPDP